MCRTAVSAWIATKFSKSSTSNTALRGVVDLPDHDRRDLDRIAVGVVDLRHLGLMVADPGRDTAGGS